MAALAGDALIAKLNAKQHEASRLLGQTVLALDAEAGTIKLSYAPDARFCNGLGVIQGGFVAAMLDDAASLACVVKARANIAVPTLEMKVSYLSAVHPGPVFAHGRVLKMGRKIVFLAADLLDGDGKLLAQSTATAMHQARA